MVVVRLTDAAVEDVLRLYRSDPQIARWALKKMLLLERDPEAGQPLVGDLVGWRKVTVGDRDWRVIWRVTHDVTGAVVVDVAEVWAAGARSDREVYAEMSARVSSLPSSPRTQTLAEVVTRFGAAAAGLSAAAEPAPKPDLPRWLQTALVETVGLPIATVDSLSLDDAVETWTAWTSRPRPGS